MLEGHKEYDRQVQRNSNRPPRLPRLNYFSLRDSCLVPHPSQSLSPLQTSLESPSTPSPSFIPPKSISTSATSLAPRLHSFSFFKYVIIQPLPYLHQPLSIPHTASLLNNPVFNQSNRYREYGIIRRLQNLTRVPLTEMAYIV